MDSGNRKAIEQNLRALLCEIDNHHGVFSDLIYTCLQDIFHEPAMKESGLDPSQAVAAFMARRLQQAMPLSARMSPVEENSLNAVIRDVGVWKERTGYVYHYGAKPFEGSMPNRTDIKLINSIVLDYFTSLNLKDISSTKGGGYLTWRGNEFFDKTSVRLTFDIRKKYDWRMRFNLGIFDRDGELLCNISDWEIFSKIIYAEIELNFDFYFEHCDTLTNGFFYLKNYLSIIGLILNKIRSW